MGLPPIVLQAHQAQLWYGFFPPGTPYLQTTRQTPPKMHVLYGSASALAALPQGRPSFGPRVTCHGARDRVVDFGKYKGRMLGTLPSSYLRWVSNNLRAGDFEHWARLADQVLRDPVYNDRIEWEFAEAVLKGSSNGPRFYSLRDGDGGATAELLEIGQRFGWDYEDKAAWSKLDFDLLGTSRGGRIPRRVGDRCGGVSEAGGGNSGGREGAAAAAGIDERRRGRRERAMMKMKKEKGAAAADEVATTLMTGRRDGGGGGKRSVVVEGNGEGERSENSGHNPFPGRESLLRKVLGTWGDHHHANGMEG